MRALAASSRGAKYVRNARFERSHPASRAPQPPPARRTWHKPIASGCRRRRWRRGVKGSSATPLPSIHRDPAGEASRHCRAKVATTTIASAKSPTRTGSHTRRVHGHDEEWGDDEAVAPEQDAETGQRPRGNCRGPRRGNNVLGAGLAACRVTSTSKLIWKGGANRGMNTPLSPRRTYSARTVRAGCRRCVPRG